MEHKNVLQNSINIDTHIHRHTHTHACTFTHTHLTKNLLKKHRPISNLPFLSKILEKVILHKLLSDLQENHLSNPFQSAYQSGHSTETVLLGVVNDILSALDNDNISVLLLDLSAAFDTIDHQFLLSHLNCFWHSVYCTPVVSVIALRQISVHFS